jgi:hypothetical protein
MTVGARLKDWARTIKKDVVALYIAGRDPQWTLVQTKRLYQSSLAALVTGKADEHRTGVGTFLNPYDRQRPGAQHH